MLALRFPTVYSRSPHQNPMIALPHLFDVVTQVLALRFECRALEPVRLHPDFSGELLH
jgi:hypothetical protein